jgi:hypothetical protein
MTTMDAGFSLASLPPLGSSDAKSISAEMGM